MKYDDLPYFSDKETTISFDCSTPEWQNFVEQLKKTTYWSCKVKIDNQECLRMMLDSFADVGAEWFDAPGKPNEVMPVNFPEGYPVYLAVDEGFIYYSDTEIIFNALKQPEIKIFCEESDDERGEPRNEEDSNSCIG